MVELTVMLALTEDSYRSKSRHQPFPSTRRNLAFEKSDDDERARVRQIKR